MCAYNIRKNKTVNYDPAHGPRRTRNLLQELVVFGVCVVLAYLVFLLARHYLDL